MNPLSTNPSPSASKIAGGATHLGELNEKTFGKIIIVLDEASKTLHLVGALSTDLMKYYRPSSETEEEMLRAVSSASSYLGSEAIQLHRKIRFPENVRGPILGGAAAYYDGCGTLYINAKSVDFGALTRKGVLFCLNGFDKKVVLGSDVLADDNLWNSKAERKAAWALRS